MRKIIILIIAAAFALKTPVLAEDKPAKLRLISLAPSTTEILFALGLKDQVVGVSTFCNYPEQVKDKDKVGSFSQPNIEKILSLNPDIVFCTGLEQGPVIKKLKQLNLNVYVSDPANTRELFDSILHIGELTAKTAEAQALVEDMQMKIEDVTFETKFMPVEFKPGVFVEYWNNPLMTAGRGSFIDELITLAGGINIAHDASRPYTYFSPEQVIQRDPDCIFLVYMVNEEAAAEIKLRLGWQGISAIRNDRVYSDIDPDLILRPGPRIVEGLEEIHKRLYPPKE